MSTLRKHLTPKEYRALSDAERKLTYHRGQAQAWQRVLRTLKNRARKRSTLDKARETISCTDR